ncbi:hypothetical protein YASMINEVIRUS_1460 [Yasminevirus sp. GU-2018]|uniref:Uncharacterized protein n=1 Tax=Yasminevirus sp. GU-2018 TaxID=2420051 RepID=A0A5K0UA88_9VIRU|nr:hypothetical protein YASMINEVIRUS_1460 [Yasminevirus sp. GU-2018]
MSRDNSKRTDRYGDTAYGDKYGDLYSDRSNGAQRARFPFNGNTDQMHFDSARHGGAQHNASHSGVQNTEFRTHRSGMMYQNRNQPRIQLEEDDDVLQQVIAESIRFEKQRTDEQIQLERAISLSKMALNPEKTSEGGSSSGSSEDKLDDSDLMPMDVDEEKESPYESVSEAVAESTTDTATEAITKAMSEAVSGIVSEGVSESTDNSDKKLDDYIKNMVRKITTSGGDDINVVMRSASGKESYHRSDQRSDQRSISLLAQVPAQASAPGSISTSAGLFSENDRYRKGKMRKTHHETMKSKYGADTKIRPHFDFIIGRGKTYPPGYMNLPLNPALAKRNIIYIDPNPVMNADIQKYLHEVDFSHYGICDEQDPSREIDVRFIFDWSSFYCGALSSLTNIVLGIGRKCQILVPLDPSEREVPGDILRELNNDLFTISTVEGRYPLFDWSYDDRNKSDLDPMTQERKMVSSRVNPRRYVRIEAFDEKYE